MNQIKNSEYFLQQLKVMNSDVQLLSFIFIDGFSQTTKTTVHPYYEEVKDLYFVGYNVDVPIFRNKLYGES